MAATQSTDDTRLLLSGGAGQPSNSSRDGFLPVSLTSLQSAFVAGLPVYLRGDAEGRRPNRQGPFTLYRSPEIPFTDADRDRLVAHGVEFVYVRIEDQRRFREQAETHLRRVAGDPTMSVSESAALIYETSVELINEVLAEPDLAAHSSRLDALSRSIATLVVNSPSAFSHLFTASHHDFYTATHMVNVAAWMVPLAYTLGYQDPDELSHICQAGLLHDIGKVYISEDILNKKGRLEAEEWELLTRHAQLGVVHLSQYDFIPEVVVAVTREHHERMDGSGYPNRLKGDDIHPVSRICAVVDSFDAMTAFRPFKTRTMSVPQAIDILRSETPTKYDPEVLEAWLGLMGSVEPPAQIAPPAEESPSPMERRRDVRRYFQCPARAHVLDPVDDGWEKRPGVQVVAHNVSRSGMGFLAQRPMDVGEQIRVYIDVRAWTHEYVEGQCVRCRRHGDGWYEVGLRLTGASPTG